MEKVSFVRNGVIRLPPGFRFHPTDEELVVQYLRRKVFAYPLPASIIPEIDICKHEPWELPGDREQERYFFTTREAKYRNGNRPNRATGSGYWKATGLDKRILLSKSNQVVGMKKTLVFYRGKPSNATKTDWIMHEYRLSDAATKSITEAGDWVICRVFLKKTSSKKGDHCTTAPTKYNNKDVAVAVDLTLGRTTFIDFMKMSSSSSSSSSSASSGITDISSNNDDSCSCSSLSASSRRREPESF